MTTEQSPASSEAVAGEVEWTRQGPGLWAGRRDGRPVGTIEQGLRFTFIDLDGTRRGGHRTLRDAQAAATAVADTCSTWPPGRYSPRERAVIVGSSIVLGVAAALMVVAFVLLS